MVGADRTGSMHTAYMISEKGKSLEEALDICKSATTAGLPSEPYIKLVTAYAAEIKKPETLVRVPVDACGQTT